ncbi:hypothetical protein RUND412_010571 [Rhizina undulata]
MRNLDEYELDEARKIVERLGELPLALELSPEAQHLLHLYAFLRNEDFPDELFCRGKSAVPWLMKDENKLDKAIRSLFTFCFAKRKESGDSFWIHPLVHSWARDHTDRSTQQRNAEDTITLLGASTVKDRYDRERRTEDWMFERRILNHLEGFQEHISQFFSELDSIKAAELLAGRQRVLGSDHCATLDTILNIGRVFYYQDRYTEALEWLQKALEGQQKVLGKDYHNALNTVIFIGNALIALYQEKRKLAAEEKLLGKNHPRALYNLPDVRALCEKLD